MDKKSMFVNPYNFIPLGNEKKSDNESPEEMHLTGVIEYDLLTKTPLFIPNTSNDDVFRIRKAEGDNHTSYDFFSYDDLDTQADGTNVFHEPVIPGSEMRGMIRSNFEILTDSCLSAVDEDFVFSKRTSEVFQAALIKKEVVGDGAERKTRFSLVKAEDYIWRTEDANNTKDAPASEKWDKENPSPDRKIFNRQCYIQLSMKEGDRVAFISKPRKRGKPLALEVKSDPKGDGYLLKGEPGPYMDGNPVHKHNAHIFKPTSEVIANDISLGYLKKLEKIYKDNANTTNAQQPQPRGTREHKAYAEYYRELKAFEKGGNDYFPVYYSKISGTDNPSDKLLFLSPAAITREIYRANLIKMLGSHAPCTDRNNLCPACRLFGRVYEKSGTWSVNSRIRVSDLRLKEKVAPEHLEEVYERKWLTLPPLGGPKPQNMEFYLKRPENAWFWTYDYYIDKEGKCHRKEGEINGRKFYWHNMDATVPDNIEATGQNITVRPLKRGCVFHGKIYFDGISETELRRLCYLINAADNGGLASKKHGYKLGGAKPLGFGSVAMKITAVNLRTMIADAEKGKVIAGVKNGDRYLQGMEQVVSDKVLESSFELMTSFDAVAGMKVSYPELTKDENKQNKDRTEDNLQGFSWFTKNHTALKWSNNKGKYIENNSPNQRTQQVLAEYMESMKPQLRPVGFFDFLESDAAKQKRPGERKTSNSRKSNDRHSVNNPGRQKEFAREVQRESARGKVVGYNPQKTSMKIQTDDRGMISVFFRNMIGKSDVKPGQIDRSFPIGTRVTCEYRGKDKEGRDQWYYNHIESQKMKT